MDSIHEVPETKSNKNLISVIFIHASIYLREEHNNSFIFPFTPKNSLPQMYLNQGGL